ncbi:hemolysin-III related subfamily protein, partial [Cardiosporidium cionae]
RSKPTRLHWEKLSVLIDQARFARFIGTQDEISLSKFYGPASSFRLSLTRTKFIMASHDHHTIKKTPDGHDFTKIQPVLRGKVHLILSIISPIWIYAILYQCQSVSSYIASVTTIICSLFNFTASTALHNFTWDLKYQDFVLKLDYAGIFLMISGSAIPIPVLLMERWKSIFILTTQSIFAITGAYYTLIGPLLRSSRKTRSFVYILAGFSHLLFLSEYLRVLSRYEFHLTISLALLYVFGAIIYARRWPDPFPTFFGYHEIFHTCCLGSAICTYLLITSVLKRSQSNW